MTDEKAGESDIVKVFEDVTLSRHYIFIYNIVFVVYSPHSFMKSHTFDNRYFV
jgi:hypothetical protein